MGAGVGAMIMRPGAVQVSVGARVFTTHVFPVFVGPQRANVSCHSAGECDLVAQTSSGGSHDCTCSAGPGASAANSIVTTALLVLATVIAATVT